MAQCPRPTAYYHSLVCLVERDFHAVLTYTHSHDPFGTTLHTNQPTKVLGISWALFTKTNILNISRKQQLVIQLSHQHKMDTPMILGEIPITLPDPQDGPPKIAKLRYKWFHYG